MGKAFTMEQRKDYWKNFANKQAGQIFHLVEENERLKEIERKHTEMEAMFVELYNALFCADKWMQKGEGSDEMWKGANNIVSRALQKAKRLQEGCGRFEKAGGGE